MGPRTADNIRKKFHQIFDEVGHKITVQAKLKIVNFLDITLNLTTEKFCPYRKPDNPPLYINSQSNHPPAILKHLPSGIGKRTSSLSVDKTEFDKAAPSYRDALKASGFNQPMEYTSNSPPPPPHAAETNREERDLVKSFGSTLRLVKVLAPTLDKFSSDSLTDTFLNRTNSTRSSTGEVSRSATAAWKTWSALSGGTTIRFWNQPLLRPTKSATAGNQTPVLSRERAWQITWSTRQKQKPTT